MTDAMVTIQVPADLILTIDLGTDQSGKDLVREQKFSFFKDFLRRTVMADQKWGQNSDWVLCAVEILALFKDKQPGDTVLLSNDQYNRLKEVVKQPSAPYNPVICVHIVPYLLAVLEPDRIRQAPGLPS